MDVSAVEKALTRAYENAEERPVLAGDTRIVVFSDQHKGTRDGADDFERCEPAYCAALGWYLEQGYSLFVLGDVEELWENDPAPVLARGTGYAEVLELEAAFQRAGRYERFYGNHDDLWSHEGPVHKHLQPILGDIHVREALKLRVERPGRPDGTIVLLHGHQGTAASDQRRFFSRWFVRFVWRPIQRKSGYTGVTPAQNHELRTKHDRQMAAWASTHPDRPVLVAGHTHRPVFWDSLPRPAPAPMAGVGPADTRAVREFESARRRNPQRAYTLPTPCYFNTGCCCFGDGDVTGLELAEGEIRLVRWPQDDGSPQRKILASRSLDEVLDAVAHSPTAPVTGSEIPLAAQ